MTMEINEYSALREEIISRISLINTQENTALSTTIGFWAASVALFAINPQIAQNLPALQLLLNCFQALILIIPNILMVPIAFKSGENIYQIAIISSYIKVFYEYASLIAGRKNTLSTIACWEFVNDITSTITGNNKRKRGYLMWLNNCYTVLASISVLLYAIESFLILMRWNAVLGIKDFCILAVALGLFLIISIILVVIIFRESSVRTHFVEAKEKAIPAFLKRAKAIGIISSDSLELYDKTVKYLLQ